MANVDDKIMTNPEKVDYILDGICTYFGVEKKAMCNKNYSRSHIFDKKRYAMVILYDYTACSFGDIKRLLGYHAATVILYHYKNLKQELSGELYGSEKVKRTYNDLLTYLKLKDNES